MIFFLQRGKGSFIFWWKLRSRRQGDFFFQEYFVHILDTYACLEQVFTFKVLLLKHCIPAENSVPSEYSEKNRSNLPLKIQKLHYRPESSWSWDSVCMNSLYTAGPTTQSAWTASTQQVPQLSLHEQPLHSRSHNSPSYERRVHTSFLLEASWALAPPALHQVETSPASVRACNNKEGYPFQGNQSLQVFHTLTASKTTSTIFPSTSKVLFFQKRIIDDCANSNINRATHNFSLHYIT